VNLTQIRLAVPEIFEAQTKKVTALKQNVKPWFHVKIKLF